MKQNVLTSLQHQNQQQAPMLLIVFPRPPALKSTYQQKPRNFFCVEMTTASLQCLTKEKFFKKCINQTSHPLTGNRYQK